jgi:tRNA pseudouridine55 synthase
MPMTSEVIAVQSASGRHSRRSIDGILLLDKPADITSNRALQVAKGLFRARKAGHTGSLDPLATGLLPICFGAATRLSEFLLGARKTYRVKCLLGVATDSGDAHGEVVGTAPQPRLTALEIESVLRAFIGESDQVPPMYSALKHQGRRLYEFARQGIDVPRPARRITIFSIEDLAVELPHVSFTVACSKGTYVRSLVEDMAVALGTVGHVLELRRLGVGPFSAAGMIDLPSLRALAGESEASLDAVLLPVDQALPDWPALHMGADSARRLCQGQAVGPESVASVGLVKIYGPAAEFLGVGEVLADGRVAPRRIFQAAALGASRPVQVEYAAG